METATYGLTHLAVAVSNLKRTLQFYQQVFQMKVMYHEDKMIQLTTPGSNDILVFEENVGDSVGQSAGIAHFGFRLRHPSGIEDIYARVLAAGGKVIDKGEFVPGSPYVFFKDPDGYVIEVWYELLP
jgi:catechol 2,3-dioxygenase-like lactoylglutathione lyase family enzyme